MTKATDEQETVTSVLRRHWLAAAIGFGVACLGSLRAVQLIAEAPSAQTAVGLVNALGLVLGAWGVALSIGGFAVTWWQLQRTQNAAGAVRKALEGIKADYNSFDLITEVRTAKGYTEFSQAHVTQSRWNDALTSFKIVRLSLVKITAVKNGLHAEYLEVAKNLLATTSATCASIERLIANPEEELSIEIINGHLRSLEEFLINLEFMLRDAIRG